MVSVGPVKQKKEKNYCNVPRNFFHIHVMHDKVPSHRNHCAALFFHLPLENKTFLVIWAELFD